MMNEDRPDPVSTDSEDRPTVQPAAQGASVTPLPVSGAASAHFSERHREAAQKAAEDAHAPKATRKDLHLGRRVFHLINGVTVATAYALLFTRQQAISLLGTIACVIYVLEQIRMAYPEISRRMHKVTQFVLRAEEQFKESAMIPYLIALLLSILTFPKPVALISIFTLAIADPLSAVVGIRYGKTHWVKDKTVEGSAAFFVAAFGISVGVLLLSVTAAPLGAVLLASLIVGMGAAGVEMVPVRLDDNLTIPLAVGFLGWATFALFGFAI